MADILQISKKRTASLLLMVLFLTLPFERIFTFDYAGFTVKPPYIAGMALVGCFFYLVSSKKIKIKLKNYDYAALVFVFFSYMTFFWSIDKTKTLIISSMFLFVYLIFLSVRNLALCHSERLKRSEESIKIDPSALPQDDKKRHEDHIIDFYLNFFIWLGAATSTFAIFQFFGDSFGLSQHFTGLANLYRSNVFGFPRVQSTLFEPGFFANFLLIPIFVNLNKLSSNKFAYYISFIFIFTAFLLTLSRGGFYAFGLAFVFVSVLIAVFARSQFPVITRSLLLILISVLLSFGSIWYVSGRGGVEKFSDQSKNTQDVVSGSTSESAQNFTRNATIKIALNTWKKNVLGIGIGGFGKLPDFAQTRAFGNQRQTVNSLYPEILVEGGAQSLLAFMVFIWLILWGLLAPVLSKGPVLSLSKDFSAPDKLPRGATLVRTNRMTSRQRLTSILLSAAVLAVFVQYLSFSTLYLIYVWAFLGVVAAHIESSKE